MASTSSLPQSSDDDHGHNIAEGDNNGPEATAIDPGHLIKLTNSEGKEFLVSYKVISKCTLVKNLFDDLGVEDDDDPIPLPNVNAHTFEKVLEWCTQHVDDPNPYVDDYEDEFQSARSIIVSPWDRQFFDIENEFVFDIIMAAKYLNIEPLLDVGCKTVADRLRGKTVEQIREMFGIENDFTPEEEEAIRRENEWAMAD